MVPCQDLWLKRGAFMGHIKVNTDVVVSVANNVHKINNDVRDQIPSVETAIRTLNNSWEGSVATQAMDTFNSIKNAYCDSHYKVIENFVNFLLTQVGEGYTQTETANLSLADAFK